MKYKYDGIQEFQGLVIESDVPKEEWVYGTFVTLTKPGEICQVLSPERGITHWMTLPKDPKE